VPSLQGQTVCKLKAGYLDAAPHLRNHESLGIKYLVNKSYICFELRLHYIKIQICILLWLYSTPHQIPLCSVHTITCIHSLLISVPVFFIIIIYRILYRFYWMVQVLNENSMLLSYDNVPCISFCNKRIFLMMCCVYMWPGPAVDHPPPSSAKVKERVELYLYSSAWP
jgi:hypothetical protein